jgi:hypothetical protein
VWFGDCLASDTRVTDRLVDFAAEVNAISDSLEASKIVFTQVGKPLVPELCCWAPWEFVGNKCSWRVNWPGVEDVASRSSLALPCGYGFGSMAEGECAGIV